MFPAVARRSLASTTPSSHTTATIVVACGSAPAVSLGSGKPRNDPPGSNCGAYDDKNPAKDDDSRAWKGTRRPRRSTYILLLLSPPATPHSQATLSASTTAADAFPSCS